MEYKMSKVNMVRVDKIYLSESSSYIRPTRLI